MGLNTTINFMRPMLPQNHGLKLFENLTAVLNPALYSP